MSRTGHEFDIDRFLVGPHYSTWYRGINPEGSRRLPPPAVPPLPSLPDLLLYYRLVFSAENPPRLIRMLKSMSSVSIPFLVLHTLFLFFLSFRVHHLAKCKALCPCSQPQWSPYALLTSGRSIHAVRKSQGLCFCRSRTPQTPCLSQSSGKRVEITVLPGETSPYAHDYSMNIIAAANAITPAPATPTCRFCPALPRVAGRVGVAPVGAEPPVERVVVVFA